MRIETIEQIEEKILNPETSHEDRVKLLSRYLHRQSTELSMLFPSYESTLERINHFTELLDKTGVDYQEVLDKYYKELKKIRKIRENIRKETEMCLYMSREQYNFLKNLLQEIKEHCKELPYRYNNIQNILNKMKK